MKKILISTLISLSFSFIPKGLAQSLSLRHSYVEISSPLNDEFPFGNGILDLDQLNPSVIYKDKVSHDTTQVWNRTNNSWENSSIIKISFASKCGRVLSRYDYQFDSLKKPITAFIDTFSYENNLIKSIQNYEIVKGVKSLYANYQYYFQSNKVAPDTVYITDGNTKQRITYTYNMDAKPTTILEDEIATNQTIIPISKSQLIYDKGLLTDFTKSNWINGAWKKSQFTNYSYTNAGTLKLVYASADDFIDTLIYRYTYDGQNKLIQYNKDLKKNNTIQNVLTYKLSNPNSNGFALDVTVEGLSGKPFVKNYIVQTFDINGKNPVNSLRQTFTYCNPTNTNIQNLITVKLQLYPNPAQSFIKIASDEFQNTPFNVSIFDAFGKMVFSEQGVQSMINVEGLSNGMYLVKIDSKDKVGSASFVILK